MLAEYRYGDEAKRPNSARKLKAIERAEDKKDRYLGDCYDPNPFESEEEEDSVVSEDSSEEDAVVPEESSDSVVSEESS